LFSRWWPQWRDSLIIVQPETILRWRRAGWSALWRYRSWGRWRGGRPPNRAHTRAFQAILGEVQKLMDWMVEQKGFEPSVLE
jgi:hypothetical protein